MAAGTSFTQIGVSRMKPPAAGRVDVFDAEVGGLLLRVSHTGTKVWMLRKRVGASMVRAKIGTFPNLSVKDARAAAIKMMVELKEGPAVRPARAITVQAAISEHIDRDQRPKNRAWKEVERTLNKECAPWLNRKLADITKADVLQLLDGIVDRGSPTMANRALAHIRRLFNWSLERDLVQVSPCATVKAPGAEVRRDRVLKDEEITAVWHAMATLNWPFRQVFQLLLLTAQRRDEVGAMTWDELDLKASRWTIPSARAKNGVEHVIPLSAPVLEILKGAPVIAPKDDAPGFVFTTNGRTPLSGFSKAKERVDTVSGVTGWRLHDLRRTAASGIAALHHRAEVVESILNHKHPSGTALASLYNRYGYEPEVRQALKEWSEYILKIVSAR